MRTMGTKSDLIFVQKSHESMTESSAEAHLFVVDGLLLEADASA